MDTVTSERARSPTALQESHVEAILGKPHTFTWIFPGCTELLFCGPGAMGLGNHMRVPKGLAVRRGTFASFLSASDLGYSLAILRGRKY